MNPKFRVFYLLGGAAGLFLLFYKIISSLPDVDPVMILAISVPDLLLIFLAYKTYPPEPAPKRRESFQQRKVTNY